MVIFTTYGCVGQVSQTFIFTVHEFFSNHLFTSYRTVMSSFKTLVPKHTTHGQNGHFNTLDTIHMKHIPFVYLKSPVQMNTTEHPSISISK